MYHLCLKGSLAGGERDLKERKAIRKCDEMMILKWI
jgi:hypothetical protein